MQFFCRHIFWLVSMYIFETLMQPKWELWRELTILKTQVGARESGNRAWELGLGAEPGSGAWVQTGTRMKVGRSHGIPCDAFILSSFVWRFLPNVMVDLIILISGNVLPWGLECCLGEEGLRQNSLFLMGVWQWIQRPVTVLGAETRWPLRAQL